MIGEGTTVSIVTSQASIPVLCGTKNEHTLGCMIMNILQIKTITL